MPMDEKQKMMILGGLGVVLVGAATWQFVFKHDEPVAPPPVAAKAAPGLVGDPTDPMNPAPAAPKDPIKNPGVAMNLARRDPFAMPDPTVRRLKALDPANAIQPPPPMPVTRLNVNSHTRTNPDGSLVLNGQGGPGLPSPAGSGGPIDVGGPAGVEPPVVVVHPPFGYTVVGIVLGRVPAVVLADGAGNQKLVTEGSAIDGDSVVRSVGQNKVIVSYFGKTVSLPVGEKSNAQ